MMNMIMEQPIFLRCPSAGRAYTMEKYVFGLITTMLAWGVFTAAALGATYYRQIEIDLRQWLVIAVTYLAVFSAAACHNHTDTV